MMIGSQPWFYVAYALELGYSLLMLFTEGLHPYNAVELSDK